MLSDLDKLNELLEEQIPPPRRELVKSFADRVFEKAPPEFLREFSPETLLGLAQSAVELISSRKSDEVLTRAYNPTLEVEGWTFPNSVLELLLKDRPFVFDSVRACLRRLNVRVVGSLHPILGVARDSAGVVNKPLLERPTAETAEAFEIFLMERLEESRLREVESAVREILGDVVLATDDYTAMMERTRSVRDHLDELAGRLHQLPTLDGAADIKEYRDFMEWLGDDNFVFLGYRIYDICEIEGQRCLHAAADSALGILRKMGGSTYRKPVPLAEIPADLRERIIGGPILLVSKSNSESTVHRPARMDYIGVKKYDDRGQAGGEIRFLGLFTSKALSTPVDRIPIVRRKLKQVLSLDDSVPGSHDFKQIVAIFNSMPREELFWSPAEQLHRDIRTIMSLEEERDVRISVRPDPMSRGLAVMVIMSRDHFNTEVRRKLQDYLAEQLRATHVDYHLAMSADEAQVRFHFFFTTHVSFDSLDLAAIDRQVAELARSWDDRLFEGLLEKKGSEAAGRLIDLYRGSFSDAYKAEVSAAEAVRDIEYLEALAHQEYAVALENVPVDKYRQQATHLKLYHREKTLILSEVFPGLENLGLRVIEQISYPVPGVESGRDRGVDIFRVVDRQGNRLNVEEVGERLNEAVLLLLSRQVENDRLNELVLSSGLSVREIQLLRVLRQYLSQLQAATSRSFITDALLSSPSSAAAIFSFFRAKFDPDGQGERVAAMDTARRGFLKSLNEVTSLPLDRTLRALFQLVVATVRTNFFQSKPAISLKIRSADVEEMPDPRPLFEIMVVGPRVEGIHLRGGKVARGGLRWSDRPDDFRTEVLGLMKTQMTKNAVIVPVGSKGGFVLKNAPADREAIREFVQAEYQTFIRGLLDLTDNIVDGKTVHPEGLVIHDEPDPYLVVAADKGTATFSDIANAISEEYGFWLGDAFASGGSYGYDHKKEGITARGAWECVARHFRELGIDVRKDEFSAVGIGDMSGDVFGNGFLYTNTIRLVAAFNHQNIFLDPNPDPKRSFEERTRLFSLPRSTWEDYDGSLISPGGGIYSRGAKAISLSPEARQLLGVEEESLSGQDLVRAILRMRVDLLWNGGIGTYVKAGSERHSEVGDSANDGVRINADEVGARIVGEGGNLGFTQLARIEYCLLGGRMNTDAIDNSAGVDMSDHEVNIKILLQPTLRNGGMTLEARNDLLKAMTDEVSDLVLKDNYGQSLCLSMAERKSRQNLRGFESLLESLTESGELKPAVEFLPGRKALLERSRNGLGLVRPELAILLAYTKMRLQRLLLETDLPDRPELQPHLVSYFPAVLQEKFRGLMPDHPLRREIVACQVTSLIVDRLGMTFVHELLASTGASPSEVIWSTLSALEALELESLWAQVFELDNEVAAATQYALLEEIQDAVRGAVQWLILSGIPSEEAKDWAEKYRVLVLELWGRLAELLSEEEASRFSARCEKLEDMGLPNALAGKAAGLSYLTSLLGAAEASRRTGAALLDTARAFYRLGERLSLGWMRDGLAQLEKANSWEDMGAGIVISELRRIQANLTMAYVTAGSEGGPDPVQDFLAGAPSTLARFDEALERIRSRDEWGLISGAVLTRVLRQLSEQLSAQAQRSAKG